MSTIDNAELAKLLEDRQSAISEKSGFPRLEAIDLFNRTCHQHLPTILSALRGQEGWRPIKTVPFDEPVLVAGGDVSYPVVASWSGLHDEPWQIDAQEDLHGEIGWPTHWMPLPAAHQEAGR